MEEFSKKWIEGATEDLDVAELLFVNKKYRQAMFYLQQTCEKTAKGFLMIIGFLPDSDESEELKEAREFIGVKSAVPRDYGHKLIGTMLDALDSMVTSTTPIFEMMLKLPDKEMVSKVQGSWNVADFRSKINKAREIKFNPNPTIEDIDATLNACNRILGISIDTEGKVMEDAKNVKIPSKDVIIETIEKETGLKLDDKAKDMLDKIYQKPPEEYLSKKTIHSFTLTTLMVLNTYMLPHEWLARYPDSTEGIEYNENLPLIKRFDGLSALLRRCIELSK
jgi:hypothetical protein